MDRRLLVEMRATSEYDPNAGESAEPWVAPNVELVLHADGRVTWVEPSTAEPGGQNDDYTQMECRRRLLPR